MHHDSEEVYYPALLEGSPWSWLWLAKGSKANSHNEGIQKKPLQSETRERSSKTIKHPLAKSSLDKSPYSYITSSGMYRIDCGTGGFTPKASTQHKRNAQRLWNSGSSTITISPTFFFPPQSLHIFILSSVSLPSQRCIIFTHTSCPYINKHAVSFHKNPYMPCLAYRLSLTLCCQANLLSFQSSQQDEI